MAVPAKHSRALRCGHPLYQRTSDVANRDMSFLDSLRILRGHVEQKIDFAGECATRLARKTNYISTAGPASFYTAHYVWAFAAGRERHKNVLRSDERFDLTGENALESVVIAGRGEHRWICRQRQRCEATSIGSQPHDKLSRKVQRIGCASAISEKDYFSAAAERRRAFFCKLSDAPDKLVGKALLYASAFLELASYFFGG
jgi:hypothetical protein